MYATITDWQTETPATPENLTYGIPASWMISGLVLKQREDTGLGISQKLIYTMLSGKVVYSDKALTTEFP